MPVLKRFTVVGLFSAGMYQYDRSLALIHIADGARLFRLKDDVSGLRLRLDNIFAAPRTRLELSQNLPGMYQVRDWTQEHANFFRAVQIEKTAMFVILMLIVAVAAFNLVSTLVMVVTDKQADIAILRTLGAAPRSIMAIFMVQGMTIGLIGTLLGLFGGISLALNVDRCCGSLYRKNAGYKISRPGCLFDQRFTLAGITGRRHRYCRHRLCTSCSGHALSSLACCADSAGRGIAL